VGNWTLLSGHGHVLVEIARNPQARIRDIAATADLSQRTVQAIIADFARLNRRWGALSGV
jgi:DNA-binding MarR family transcriptional regulator